MKPLTVTFTPTNALSVANWFVENKLGVPLKLSPLSKKPTADETNWQKKELGWWTRARLERAWGEGSRNNLGISPLAPLFFIDIDVPYGKDPEIWIPSYYPELWELKDETVHEWTPNNGLHLGVICRDFTEEELSLLRGRISSMQKSGGVEVFVGGASSRGYCAIGPSVLGVDCSKGPEGETEEEEQKRLEREKNGWPRMYAWDLTEGEFIELPAKERLLGVFPDELKEKFERCLRKSSGSKGVKPTKEGSKTRVPLPKPRLWEGEGDVATLQVGPFLEELGVELFGEGGPGGNWHYFWCLWHEEHEHKGHRDNRTCCGIQDRQDEGMVPLFRCQHGHCQERGLRELLIEADRRKPGIVDRHCALRWVDSERNRSKTTEKARGVEEPEDPIIEKMRKAKAIPKVKAALVINPKEGTIAKKVINLQHVIALDPRVSEVRVNTFTGTDEIKFGFDGEDWRPCNKVTDQCIAVLLSGAYSLEFGHKVIRGAVIARADTNPFHNVRHYLESLPPWDGAPRIRTILDRYTEDTPLRGDMVERFFVQAVARAMEPGCKVDTALILVGRQGLGKSTFFRTLVPEAGWFADTALDIRHGNKDTYIQIRGKWIYELSEMVPYNQAEAEAMKSLLSSQFDNYRKPYREDAENVPRTCVFAGTTNDMTFLKDPTGARRFWPLIMVRVFNPKHLPPELRDRLWAEALHYYREGRIWWMPLEQDEILEAHRRATHEQEDIMEHRILQCAEKFHEKLGSASILDILNLSPGKGGLKDEILGTDKQKHMRIASVLQRAGWVKVRTSGRLKHMEEQDQDIKHGTQRQVRLYQGRFWFPPGVPLPGEVKKCAEDDDWD